MYQGKILLAREQHELRMTTRMAAFFVVSLNTFHVKRRSRDMLSLQFISVVRFAQYSAAPCKAAGIKILLGLLG